MKYIEQRSRIKVMTLTIPEAKGTYEKHEFLRAADVKAADGKFVICAEPRQGNTQFGDRTFIDVTPANGDTVFTWVINNTSLRHLAKDFGNEEADWNGKPVSLVIVASNIEGKLKDVIYVEGSLAKE